MRRGSLRRSGEHNLMYVGRPVGGWPITQGGESTKLGYIKEGAPTTANPVDASSWAPFFKPFLKSEIIAKFQRDHRYLRSWFHKKNYFGYFFLAGFLFSAYIFVNETFLLDSPRYFSVLKFFWFCYMFSQFFRKICFFLIFDQSFNLVSCFFLNFEPT